MSKKPATEVTLAQLDEMLKTFHHPESLPRVISDEIAQNEKTILCVAQVLDKDLLQFILITDYRLFIRWKNVSSQMIPLEYITLVKGSIYKDEYSIYISYCMPGKNADLHLETVNADLSFIEKIIRVIKIKSADAFLKVRSV